MRNEPRNRSLHPSDPSELSGATSEAPAELPLPPIRLRSVLFLTLIGLAIWQLYPRGTAAWKLHTAATSFADYALCMVGPTGPSLLRDNPAEFNKLVRRRLISSAAKERPFSACARAAGELSDSQDVERAHLATAWSFREYGGQSIDRQPRGVSIDDLRVTTRRLNKLASAAWPFERDGYTKLIRPSLSAREAVHPVELSRPAVGQGLPDWRARYRSVRVEKEGYLLAVGKAANLSVYRSRDGMLWTPAPLHGEGVSDIAERCPAGSKGSFSFGMSDDGRFTTVQSEGPDGAPLAVAMAPASQQVFAASCDEHSLVAAAKREGSRDVLLYRCGFRAGCAAMSMPRFAGVGVFPRYPLDVARVDGTTVLVVEMGKIVRVTSSRDDGQTWTPYTVAFDQAAHRDVHTDVALPGRVLTIGKRLLLYGGAPRPQMSYPLLISDDYGASFRGLAPAPQRSAQLNP